MWVYFYVSVFVSVSVAFKWVVLVVVVRCSRREENVDVTTFDVIMSRRKFFLDEFVCFLDFSCNFHHLQRSFCCELLMCVRVACVLCVCQHMSLRNCFARAVFDMLCCGTLLVNVIVRRQRQTSTDRHVFLVFSWCYISWCFVRRDFFLGLLFSCFDGFGLFGFIIFCFIFFCRFCVILFVMFLCSVVPLLPTNSHSTSFRSSRFPVGLSPIYTTSSFYHRPLS